MLIATTLASVLLGVATPSTVPAVREDTVPLDQWTVPWADTRPRDPYIDAQQRVWFVGQTGNYVAYLDPRSGQFKRFEIDADAHPHNLIVAPDGYVWFSGNTNGSLYRLDPKDGVAKRYRLPDPAVKDPHTMIMDKKGDIWFTAQQASVVGKFTTKTGEFQIVPMAKGYRPYGIVLDSKGQPWFDLFGTNKIGTIDPATMQLKEYALPHERARPRRIAVTSDDRIWYGDFSRGYTGVLDPKTGDIKEWANPSGASSRPYAMTSDDQDRIWFVETGVQPNRLVGFDPKTNEFFSNTAVGMATGNTVRHMMFDPKGKQIWFGSDANTIGRAQVPPRKEKVVP
jgi:virginiamycin B lyase